MRIKNTALLLAGADFTLASSLKSALREKGYELVYVNTFENFIDHIVLTKDAIIFIDKKRFRFLRIVKALVEKCSLFREHLIISLSDEDIFGEDFDMGNHLLFYRYGEVIPNLSKIIRKAELSKNLPANFSDREIVLSIVTDFLISSGVLPKYVGFDYIIQIVLMAAENNFILPKLQKDVYPKIALIFKVPACNIERNIRSAISYFKAGKNFKKMLVSLVGRSDVKLTTKTFLHILLIYVQTEMVKRKALNELKENK